MRRVVIFVAVVAALIVWGQNTAFAHGFTHSVGCAGLSWSATNYDAGQTNSITVTIDGAVVYQDPNFGTTDVGSRTWTQTADHAWSVVVDAPGSEFDHNRSGKQTACQPTTTTSSTTTTSTPTTSTTAPASTVPSSSTTTSTTTTPDTSTTSTDPSATTSTAPATTSPSTTSPNQPTSSVSVATTSPTEPLDNLPATGAGAPFLFGIAIGLFGAGAAAMVAARRRP